MPYRRILGLDEENLRKLYLGQKLTIGKIAERLGCLPDTVSARLKKYQIPVRSHSEEIGGRKYPGGKLAGLTKAHLRELYDDQWLTTTEIAKQYDCTGGLILLKLKELGIPLHTSNIRGLDQENLRRLYIDKKMSAIQIGEILGTSDAGVLVALKRYGIPVRTLSEAGKNKIISPDHLAKLQASARKVNLGQTGEAHPGWKGGRYVDAYGYVVVRHDGKTMREHRWVMSQHLGHPLETYEEVHHVNHDKQDNRIENLEIYESYHKRRHVAENPDWPRKPKDEPPAAK